ncbi:MAG: hypothetical protein KC425_01830 [Anaerolineales bacterium]|nr:hypothetical protein [Anaerolineales bacterium]
MGYLKQLTPASRPDGLGGKAAGLRTLARQRMRVPATWVCIWQAHLDARQDRARVLQALRRELQAVLDPGKAYAVRSSANLEDSVAFSFAGQFGSRLNVRGVDDVLAAVQDVWTSVEAAALRPYLARAGLQVDDLRMAVLIQEMVPPVFAGVAFSKNPLTGLDELIVEAVAGSGEALVQEGVTPARWVHKWGDWLAQPAETAVPHDLIQQVVQQTRALDRALGVPLDLEWVFDGEALWWVQLRAITSLRDLELYSNRISREVLPGQIKPLVWSINVPLVNSAWIDLFTELIGPNNIQPEALSKAFYYRAYFNMGAIGQIFEALGMPRETLELLMGIEGGPERPRFRPTRHTFRHLPRMLRFALGKLRYGRQVAAFLPEMTRVYAAFASKRLAELDAPALLADMDALTAFTRRVAYANIVAPLLMNLYDRLFQRQLARRGIPADRFDVMHGLAEIRDTDPNWHLDQLHAQFEALDAAARARVRAADYAAFRQLADIAPFQAAVADFLSRFGHLSDSGNDFSAVPWREQPELVLRMIADRRPAVRPAAEAPLTWETAPLTWLDRQRLGWLYRQVRAFRYYREVVSFTYTYGYGLLRNYALALGERLTARGLLPAPEAIFYLYLPEVEALVAATAVSATAVADTAARVGARQAEMAEVRDALLPDVIYGEKAPPVTTVAETAVAQRTLRGIPTSRGYFRGPVRVIESLQAFETMAPGAVLVIPYSDVSWTPLFAQAGAVIAESGGMLSHSSIVAREYRLPAVVSVTGACRLLRNGMDVTVDGFKGIVTIHEETAEKKEQT